MGFEHELALGIGDFEMLWMRLSPTVAGVAISDRLIELDLERLSQRLRDIADLFDDFLACQMLTVVLVVHGLRPPILSCSVW